MQGAGGGAGQVNGPTPHSLLLSWTRDPLPPPSSSPWAAGGGESGMCQGGGKHRLWGVAETMAAAWGRLGDHVLGNSAAGQGLNVSQCGFTVTVYKPLRFLHCLFHWRGEGGPHGYWNQNLLSHEPVGWLAAPLPAGKALPTPLLTMGTKGRSWLCPPLLWGLIGSRPPVHFSYMFLLFIFL